MNLGMSGEDHRGGSAKKNTVVLFYPRLVPDSETSTQVHFAPLGLLAIAGPLLEDGYKVLVIDSNIGETWTGKRVDANDVLCVGISAMTGHQIEDGIEFCRQVREIDRNIPVVWGGVHVSLLPEQSIASPHVDVVVVGQGEETFLDLVRHLRDGDPLEDVKGIYRKKDGRANGNPPRPFVNPDKFPPAPYHLLDIPRYLNETASKVLRSSDAFLDGEQRFLYYCSSIGCPYSCRFCASSCQTERRWVGLSAERVLDDIQRLVEKYRINALQFCDAEFFISRKRARAIAQGFIDRGFNIRWKAQVRADAFDKFDDDMVSVLKESGYVHVEIGAESGSQRMLDYIDKKITVDMVVRCAEKIKRHGMYSSFCFVFGFPTETKEDIAASFALASRIKEILPNALLPIYFFDPYPGVPLYHDSIEFGMKPPKSLEEWAGIKPNMRLPSPLIPWVDERYMNFVHKVIIFYLPLAFPADIGLGTLTHVKSKMREGRTRLLYRLAHRLAHWRVKRQFFGFPFEWSCFRFYRALTTR